LLEALAFTVIPNPLKEFIPPVGYGGPFDVTFGKARPLARLPCNARCRLVLCDTGVHKSVHARRRVYLDFGSR